MFTDDQKRFLIEIARASVREQVTGRPGSEPGRSPARVQAPVGELPTASGAFVTLKCDGELRGCLGTLESRGPLADEIARLARSTAHEDPRFEPVRASELPRISVEVSVLGPLQPIDPLDPDTIVIGRHGLVVEQGWRRGLLLPQVATEWNWTRDEFLAHTCRKAGLPADAWKHGATVYRFDAIVFGDD